jgi:hypothetical protein
MTAPRPTRTPRRPLLGSLIALSLVALASTAVPNAAAAPVPPAPPPAPAAASPQPGATRKVCQLVGEHDHETGLPTANATLSRHRFWGTDLGSSFEHGGRLYFLFGDTHAAPGLARPADRDLVASTDDADPADCLRLTFHDEGDGGYRPLEIAGVDGGAFSVPTGGFSAGGRMYVFATTDRTDGNPMGRTVLARSDDDGASFRPVRDFSSSRFINVAPVPVEAGPGLPSDGPGVLLWASGRYRQSDPRLAFLPASGVEDPGAARYFAGAGPDGAPRWSAAEADAAPLFEHPCVGELSVSWNRPLARWLMLYNCAEGAGGGSRVLMRTAERPWGPWSEPEVLFDPVRDGGACRFMNAPEAGCASVTDPHTPRVAGDPYGPYLIDRFTTALEGGAATIYFTLSTWNPYTVVLMQATLRPRGGQVASAP